MALTAADIQNVSFSIVRKSGYDVDEVDVFLEHVADEVGAMNMRIEDLERDLEEARAAAEASAEASDVESGGAAEAPSDVAELEAKIADLEAQLAEKRANDAAISQALIVAQRSADEVLSNARAAAEASAEASDAESGGAAEAPSDVSELEAKIADLEAQLAEKRANDAAISQALIVAQRSADEVLSNARAEASGIIKDADEEADRIIGKAESDRMKIAEAIKTLETDRSDVRAEYREMLSSFMADAQKKLAEIDGDSRRAAAASQARNEANAAAYAPNGGVPITSSAASVAPAPVHTTAPAASGYIDKDFSGYGAADADFEFDDID